MNYKLDIQQLDAEKLCAPQQAGEVREDYEARVDCARGKAVIRVAALDDETSTEEKASLLQAVSPYFDGKSKQQRANMIAKTMKKIGKDIISREQEKAAKTIIITPG